MSDAENTLLEYFLELKKPILALPEGAVILEIKPEYYPHQEKPTHRCRVIVAGNKANRVQYRKFQILHFGYEFKGLKPENYVGSVIVKNLEYFIFEEIQEATTPAEELKRRTQGVRDFVTKGMSPGLAAQFAEVVRGLDQFSEVGQILLERVCDIAQQPPRAPKNYPRTHNSNQAGLLWERWWSWTPEEGYKALNSHSKAAHIFKTREEFVDAFCSEAEQFNYSWDKA
jgi:hypothetical protein